jgi:hypothetical protein
MARQLEKVYIYYYYAVMAKGGTVRQL